MKILKRPDNNWKYLYTCNQCSAELEVEKTDVSYTHLDGDCREPGYDKWEATCPVCSFKFTILAKDIPKIVQLEIKKKEIYSGPIQYR